MTNTDGLFTDLAKRLVDDEGDENEDVALEFVTRLPVNLVESTIRQGVISCALLWLGAKALGLNPHLGWIGAAGLAHVISPVLRAVLD